MDTTMKSDRLKKLEAELQDLQQWMKLGLVPKKELERHQEEMRALEGRIEEEKERLRFLKESGDMEDFQAPRRQPGKPAYSDNPTMSDVGMNESSESGFEIDQESTSGETQDEDATSSDDTSYDDDDLYKDDDDPFSDRNRWKRGGIIDPESNDW
jgi:hypothetical protein